jgi:hypothetical protein
MPAEGLSICFSVSPTGLRKQKIIVAVRRIIDGQGNPVIVKIKAGGIGPFAGGYGFGVRSTVLGYFLRLDAAWEMNNFFKVKPQWYFAMGLDF